MFLKCPWWSRWSICIDNDGASDVENAYGYNWKMLQGCFEAL